LYRLHSNYPACNFSLPQCKNFFFGHPTLPKGIQIARPTQILQPPVGFCLVHITRSAVNGILLFLSFSHLRRDVRLFSTLIECAFRRRLSFGDKHCPPLFFRLCVKCYRRHTQSTLSNFCSIRLPVLKILKRFRTDILSFFRPLLLWLFVFETKPQLGDQPCQWFQTFTICFVDFELFNSLCCLMLHAPPHPPPRTPLQLFSPTPFTLA